MCSSDLTWSRRVARSIRAELAEHPAPTIVAGVERSIRTVLRRDLVQPIGMIPGNHDRTPWAALHRAAWPIVEGWMALDLDLALAAIDDARSARRLSAGIEDVWPLATAGRIDLLVVEDGVTEVAILGFCMGGMYALKAAGADRFDRAVACYGMVRVPDAWQGEHLGEPLDALDRKSTRLNSSH